MIKPTQIGGIASLFLCLSVHSMAQSGGPETTYWVGTGDEGSTFVLELNNSGKLRFIPTTGVVSNGSWQQNGGNVEMELNKKFVRLTATSEDNDMKGVAWSKRGVRWTWSAKKQPYVVATAAPEYPALARAARISGSVLVDVEIDEKGAVASIHFVSGHPLLRRASEDTAHRYRFQPAAQSETRTARLTFIFRQLDVDEEREKIISPLILSPYQVEVRRGLTVIYHQRSYVSGN